MRQATFFYLLTIPIFGLALQCYNCQTGYETQEACSNVLPSGNVQDCDGENAQCYQSIQWFQNGALRLAVRGCWTPGNDTTGDYCQNYNNTVGDLKFCESCQTDLCNEKVIYEPRFTCFKNY